MKSSGSIFTTTQSRLGASAAGTHRQQGSSTAASERMPESLVDVLRATAWILPALREFMPAAQASHLQELELLVQELNRGEAKTDRWRVQIEEVCTQLDRLIARSGGESAAEDSPAVGLAAFMNSVLLLLQVVAKAMQLLTERVETVSDGMSKLRDTFIKLRDVMKRTKLVPYSKDRIDAISTCHGELTSASAAQILVSIPEV